LKIKYLNIGLIISLHTCYIDINKFGKEFFYRTELNFFPEMFKEGTVFFLTSLIIVGQACLLIGACSQNKFRPFTKTGLFCTSIVFLIIVLFSIGKLYPMLSTLPFLIFAILTGLSLRRNKLTQQL
jgi:hypothetical protein